MSEMQLNNLQTICMSLTSSKAAERKRAAEELVCILDQDYEILKALENNSLAANARNLFTWTDVFAAEEIYFEKETERLHQSAHSAPPGKAQVLNVVVKTVRKSTGEQPFLPWFRIFNFIIKYLEQPVYADIFGQTLTSMMIAFLNQPLYVTLVQASSWSELIRLLINIYGKHKIPVITILDCLNIAITNGSDHPPVLSLLRTEVVSFYQKAFETPEGVKPHLVHFLKGLNVLSKKCAIEFRGMLCKFGEFVVPKVLHSNCFNQDQLNVEIVNFLIVQLQLHSPCDVKSGSPAFYAADPVKWFETLGNIYAFCIDSIEDIAKKKNNDFNKELSIPDTLLLLAVKCTNQLTESENDMGGGEERPVKRSMAYKSFYSIIDEISKLPPSNGQIIWITYVAAVLSEFPDLIVSTTYYATLVNVGSALLNSVHSSLEEVSTFYRSLFVCEKFLISQGLLYQHNMHTWDDVWNVTLKHFTSIKHKPESAELLRCLLVEIQPTNINSLLLSYVNRSLPVTKPTLLLLAEYLSRCALPMVVSVSSSEGEVHSLGANKTICPRISLIRWLILKSCKNDSSYIPLMATIICSLLVRRSHVLIKSENSKKENFNLKRPYTVPHEEFEKKILRISFVDVPVKINVKSADDEVTQWGTFKIATTAAYNLLEVLQDDFETCLNSSVILHKNSADFLRKFSCIQFRVLLQLNVINLLQKYGIGIGSEDSPVFKTNVETLFENSLKRFCVIMTEFFDEESIKEPNQFSTILTNMRLLLQSCHLCEQTKVFFAHMLPQEVNQVFKKTFRSSLHRYIKRVANRQGNSSFFGDNQGRGFDDGNLESTTDDIELRNKASLEALKCLIDYSLICDHRSDILKEIFDDCLAENFEIGNQQIFQLSSELILRVAPILSLPSMSEIVSPVMKMLQNLCRGFHLHPRCIQRLWELCSAIAGPIANDSDENKEHLMTLIGGLSTFISGSAPNGTHIKIQMAAFKLFNELLKHDRDLSWTMYNPKGGVQRVWVLKDAYHHLISPSHQVRICAADTVCNVFLYAAPSTNLKLLTDSQLNIIPESTQPDDHLGIERKILFDKLFPFIWEEVFNIPLNLRSDERVEEGVNRTSIALLCLTRLIFAYPLIKKKSLVSLFAMIHTKGIKVEIACRALKQANPNAIKTLCSHFSYILFKWLALKNDFKEFPYQLFECNSREIFYKKFKKEICVQLFEYNHMGALVDMAKHISMSHIDMIRECFGILFARLTPGLTFQNSMSTSTIATRHITSSTVNDIHKRLTAILGSKAVTDGMMSAYLGDIILHLVSLCFNATVTTRWGCNSIKLPEPKPPYCSEAELSKCLEFLCERCTSESPSVFAYLAEFSPKSVYKILLSFAVRIHNSHDIMEKFWRLHHFSLFVDLLKEEPAEIFNNMKEYVCHFVIHAYLRLLGGDDNKNSHFVKSILYLLTNFVEFLVFNCLEEMKIYLYPVVSSLVSLVITYPHHLPLVKKPLDILILNPELSECIVLLDPFPAHIPEFQEYRSAYVTNKYGSRQDEWDLQREIRICLDEMKFATGHCTKERLDFIRELLSTRKIELSNLIRDMDSKQSSNNSPINVIHQLIQLLVGVAMISKDHNIVREACRCLGEIGPVDLSVLVLPNQACKHKLTSMIVAISAIIEIISGYLINEDINLVVTAGDVLAAMLEVTECDNILKQEIATATNARLGGLLKPFIHNNPNAPSQGQVVDTLLESKLAINEINEFIDYTSWIKMLTCGMIECVREASLCDRLMPLCRMRGEFCEEVLPFVVFVVLYAGKFNSSVRKHLSSYFRIFFRKFVGQLTGSSEFTRSYTPTLSIGGSKKEVSIYMNKLALRSLLKVVHFLRQHTTPFKSKDNLNPSPWENNFWLDIDYMDVAKAAQYCGAYLTSILYVELYATDLEIRGPANNTNGNSSDEQYYSQNTALYPRNKNDSAEIEKVLLKAYTSIGEEDAVYGCGSALFSDLQSNMQHLEQRQKWSRVLGAQDSATKDTSNNLGICKPLKELGLFNTLWTYLEGVEAREKGSLDIPLSEIQFECGWRLSKWTLNFDKTAYINDSPLIDKKSAGSRFHKFIYEGIQAGLGNDHLKHLESIDKGLRSVVLDLQHANLESSVNIYRYLSRFQLLRMVEDFFSSESEQWIDKLLNKWKFQDKVGYSDFKYQEPFLYLRATLVHSVNESLQKPKLASAFTDCMLELLSTAREAGRMELADNCAIALGDCEKTTRKELEIAKNHWARNENDIATHMLRKLIKKNQSDTSDLFANMLLLYGDWLSDTMVERPIVILKTYLLTACEILETTPEISQKEVARANFIVAKYSDNLYQTVSRYMKSELFQEKLKQYEKATTEMHSSSTSTDQDTRRSTMVLRKQSTIEQEEIQTTMAEKKKFLLLALRHYLRGLTNSNDNDLLIFRAVALWLENSHIGSKYADDTNKVFSEENMPTYKFIVVLHQLSARMGCMESPIASMLKDILLKCAQEHPMHTLPVLLTQSLLHKDQQLVAKNCKKQVEDRVLAAAKIVEALKKDRALSALTIKMEKLWIALIHLANVQEAKNTDGLRRQMVAKTPLLSVKGLESVAVPTVYIPVSPSGKYNIIGINGFDSFYNLVGGINSPKRISCTGTNGVKYNMLLKGQDDLRQDAVMQQVFGVMNKLFLGDTKTKTKRLNVRTYKVVPLSQRSGIIEWCENTQTFGEYLVGADHEPGAHVTYRPNDYKPYDCRKKMSEVKDCRDQLKKFRVYMDITDKFKPVFRHFFFEKFKDSGMFFERRLAYTRSVATSSMVGYILGLGDRHVLNILVDKTTAEFIHIDLGVAFEQGRILPTPETIPFRLTRDIVDGMGVCGVEGVFRKSCELTLEVLRNNSEIILTILEVLLYDPLYIWTLTADRVQKVQPTEAAIDTIGDAPIIEATENTAKSDNRNNSAARVLLRLKQKLVGIEEGCSSGSSLSVPGHVTLLIQRAMEPDRLCRLFPGWQPYL